MCECRSVHFCVCMCDSLLPLRKKKKKCLAMGPEGGDREGGEGEKCTCSLNEGSCMKEIQRKKEFVGCRVANITVRPHYTD